MKNWFMPSIKLLVVNLGMAASLIVFSNASAQVVDATRQGEILQRQQQEQLRQQQERATPTQPPSGIDLKSLNPTPSGATQKGSCQLIHQIDIKGASLLDEDERATIVKPYIDHCLGALEIEKLMGEITRRYIERGFVTTRAYLPNQDLHSGRLEVVVMEGRIERMVVEGDPHGRINLNTAVPAKPGDLLNIRDLEQAVDQINAVPGNKVKMDILPGSRPGLSIIVFRNIAGNRTRTNISLDNEGSESTGRDGVSLSMQAGGFLGLNETYLITAHDSLPTNAANRSNSGSFSISVPMGYSTFGVNYALSNYRSQLQLPLGSLVVPSGHTSTITLSAQRVVQRDQNARNSVVFKIINDNASNYLDGQLLNVSSKRLNIASFGALSALKVMGGALNVNPEIDIGLSPLNNLPNGVTGSSSGPQAEFTRYSLSVDYERKFKLAHQDLGWSTQFYGQASGEALYASQQILIGSLSTVRGFYNTSISGDSGYYWRNELSWYRNFSIHDLACKARLYAGFDVGHVSNHAAGLASGTLSGAAIGAALNLDNTSVDISLTRPVGLPSGLTREPSRVWVRLAQNF